jgi:hypothetical protein
MDFMKKTQYRVNKIAREAVKNFNVEPENDTIPENVQYTPEPSSEKKTFRRPKIVTHVNNSYDSSSKVREITHALIQAERNVLRETDSVIKASWVDMVNGCQKQLDDIKNEQRAKKEAEVNSFVSHATAARSGNHNNHNNNNNKEHFNIAKKDAEDRIYKIVALSDEDIATSFSTNQIQINCKSGSVTPGKGAHSWFHDLRKREHNIIPFGPDIVVPKKKDYKTGEYRDVQFTVSHFYDDPIFVNRCKSHYSKIGIEFSINQDVRFKTKYWINLKVNNAFNKILFKNNFGNITSLNKTDGSTFGNFDENDTENYENDNITNDNIENESDTESDTGNGWDNPFKEQIEIPDFGAQVVVSSIGWDVSE